MDHSTKEPSPGGSSRWLGPLNIIVGVLFIVLALTLSGGRIPELMAGIFFLLAGCLWIYQARRRSNTRKPDQR